jgi:hypothetical protein
MGIKEVTPQNNYIAAIDALFSGTLEKEYGTFQKAIEVIFDYVKEKSAGRCIAVEVFNPDLRAKMICSLFEKYRQGAILNTICRTEFMCQITTHNYENNVNLKFLYKTVVPGEIECFPHKDEFKEAPEVLLWLREFDATVMDPLTVTTQREIIEKLPVDYQKILSTSRGALGKFLMQAAVDKWLDKEKINLIIDNIQKEDWIKEPTEEYPFTEKNVVSFFTQEYGELIEKVNNFATDDEQKKEFRKLVKRSITLGLTRFSEDPVMNGTVL